VNIRVGDSVFHASNFARRVPSTQAVTEFDAAKEPNKTLHLTAVKFVFGFPISSLRGR